MRKNIAILGAKGFIGGTLTRYLSAKKQYNVFPITRKEVDLLDLTSLKNFMKNNEIDTIIHCANQGGTRKNQVMENKIVENNLKMFFNAEACLTEEMVLINFGSGAQYDKTRDLIKVSEKELYAKIPSDSYGFSKYVMSKYINERNELKNGKIFNPIVFGLFGIGEDYTYRFISNAIVKNLIGMPIIINQNVIFDYLYIADFYKVIDYILEDRIKEKEFNLTPTESIDLVSIAQIINSISDFKSEIIVKSKNMNFEYTGNNDRFLKSLNGSFEFTSYCDAITEMYAYYKQHLDELDIDIIKNDEYLKYCKSR